MTRLQPQVHSGSLFNDQCHLNGLKKSYPPPLNVGGMSVGGVPSI